MWWAGWALSLSTRHRRSPISYLSAPIPRQRGLGLRLAPTSAPRSLDDLRQHGQTADIVIK